MRRKNTGSVKKGIACVLSAALLFGLAACGKEDGAQGGAATGGSVQDSGGENASGGADENLSVGGSGAENNGAEENGTGGGTIDDTVSIDTIREAVKEAYGEDYLPDMLLSEDEIRILYGIESEWCEEILVEVPMMSTHVDIFLAVKAKPEHLADVSDAVNAYVENLKNDTMQYPMNINKIAASTVVTMGNYVFYVMLGYLPMEMDDEADDVQIAAYEELNQKAIDVIEGVLLK
ncbi:MAG: DUF4358 domain-containing protein [Clostridium sp.]|nr:DUF4358 domain-containing protein [Clostridium sp.]